MRIVENIIERHAQIQGDKSIIKNERILRMELLGGVTGVATNEAPNYFMKDYLGVTVNAAHGNIKQVSGGHQFS